MTQHYLECLNKRPICLCSSSRNPESPQAESNSDVLVHEKVETPKKYKVILLNDDYTPMEFVILVLRRFFGKSEELAQKIMLDVHKRGAGIAGVYILEIAEMKVMQVNQFARLNQYPLKCTMEEE